MNEAFRVDPWAGQDLSSTLDMGAAMGPQTDGTYAYPMSAQPSNSPANTAGYSSDTPAWVGDVLTRGIGVLGQYFQNEKMLEYKRYEATNGGLYEQGNPALIARNGAAKMNPMLLVALLVGGVFLLTKAR